MNALVNSVFVANENNGYSITSTLRTSRRMADDF